MATATDEQVLKPGDAGYIPPGTGLVSATPGQTTTTPGTPVTTYTPAQATAQQAQATGYDPSSFNVAPNQTVKQQVGDIIGQDSSLMQQARRRADESMNQRGLLNTSMAEGAREDAVTQAALPIAMADAATYERAATNTTNAQNAAKAFTAGAQNTASNLNASMGTDVSKTNATATNTQLAQASDAALRQLLQTADNDTKTLLQSMSDKAALSRQQLTADTQLKIAQIDQDTKKYLGQLDANNRQLLQTNAGLSSMYQETVKNIAAIATDSSMTPDAKQAATQTQLNSLNEALRAAQTVATTDQSAISSLKLSQYFSTGQNAPAPTGSLGTQPGTINAPAPGNPDLPLFAQGSGGVGGYKLGSDGYYYPVTTDGTSAGMGGPSAGGLTPQQMGLA